jgi:hypothetical protein
MQYGFQLYAPADGAISVSRNANLGIEVIASTTA